MLETAQHIISLMDLTSLNEFDTILSTEKLCQKAHTSLGPVAAVCLYPQFVSLASYLLRKSQVKIATVANFPSGDCPLDAVLDTVRLARQAGVEEVDVVIPPSQGKYVDEDKIVAFLEAVKSHMGELTLKVILETGALGKPEKIRQASVAAIAGGADFLKTSTGKIAVGATTMAASEMLQVIKWHYDKTGHWVGFKASGGIKTLEQAQEYTRLAETICGEGYMSNKTFRFGASSLLDDLLAREKSSSLL